MKKIQFSTFFLPAALLTALLWTGCDKDRIKDYDIPGTYSFDNVTFAGQTDRLNMMVELVDYVKSGSTPGTVLDAQRIRDMFENTNNPFSFSSTRKLKDKCILSEVATLEAYFDQVAAASQSLVPGSNGTAGVVYSADSSKKYLCDANGFDLKERIEKSLMGALAYYQATAVYLAEDHIGEDVVDNETVVEGEGTAMEHHWDEAFGYLGVPLDFPTNTTGLLFHGKYANGRNPILACNQPLMGAFIKGRAAISNNDHATKLTQVTIILDTWERVLAACAVHYINEAKANLADDALRNHTLSEAIGFVHMLAFNPERRISDAQITAVKDAIGSNLYLVTLAGLDNARATLVSVYGFQSIQDQL
jgi:hypothetical protein